MTDTMGEFQSVRNIPITPTKNGVTIDETPLTPAPQYEAGQVSYITSEKAPAVYSTGFQPTAQAVDYTTVERHGGFKDGKGFSVHPVLPKGNIEQDIKNHLSCYSVFNNNVNTLLTQWHSMRKDLEVAREELSAKDRAYRLERDARKAAERENEKLREERDMLVRELEDTTNNWKFAEGRLAVAIGQIDKLVEKLNKAREELARMRKERDGLNVRVNELERELHYTKDLVLNLEQALRQANAGENAANERNTRLTELLYQIEAQKASIERQKDTAEARTRAVQKTVKDLEEIIDDLRKRLGRLQNHHDRDHEHGGHSRIYSTAVNRIESAEESSSVDERLENIVTEAAAAEPIESIAASVETTTTEAPVGGADVVESEPAATTTADSEAQNATITQARAEEPLVGVAA